MNMGKKFITRTKHSHSALPFDPSRVALKTRLVHSCQLDEAPGSVRYAQIDWCQFSGWPLANTMAKEGEKSEENVSDKDLVVKKNSTSAIWNYFGFRRNDVLQTQVLCKTCQTEVAISRGKHDQPPSPPAIHS